MLRKKTYQDQKSEGKICRGKVKKRNSSLMERRSLPKRQKKKANQESMKMGGDTKRGSLRGSQTPKPSYPHAISVGKSINERKKIGLLRSGTGEKRRLRFVCRGWEKISCIDQAS